MAVALTQTSLIPDHPLSAHAFDAPLESIDGDEGARPDAAFRQSIARLGVIHPVVLRLRPEGYTVVAGRRRVAAARLSGLTTIPARLVVDSTFSDAVLTIAENEQRSANLTAEMDAVATLLASGHGEDAIRQVTGMNAARFGMVTRLLHDLRPRLRDALADGRIAPSVALEASRLSAERQDGLADRLDAGEKVTARDVREAKSVIASEAVVALPDALFAPGDWRSDVTTRLRAVLALVPETEDLLRATLADAIRQTANDQGDPQ